MGIFSSDGPSDAPGFSSDLSSGLPAGNTGLFEKELEDFLLHEKQKANLNAQILEFNDLCWEKCLTDKPGSKLSGKAETCLRNCVDRFIDTTVFIMNRFAVSMQKTSMEPSEAHNILFAWWFESIKVLREQKGHKSDLHKSQEKLLNILKEGKDKVKGVAMSRGKTQNKFSVKFHKRKHF